MSAQRVLVHCAALAIALVAVTACSTGGDDAPTEVAAAASQPATAVLDPSQVPPTIAPSPTEAPSALGPTAAGTTRATATPAVPAPPEHSSPRTTDVPTAPLGPTDGEVPMLPPVPLTAPATVGGGYSAQVTGIEEVDLEGGVPGDIAGSGLAVRIQIANSGSAPLSLDRVTVSAAFGEAQEASGYDRPPAEPFQGDVRAGGRATATYVFAVPPAERDSLVVRVGPDPERVVAVFAGPEAQVDS